MKRRRALVALGVAVTLAGFGFLSAELSKRSCQLQTVRRLSFPGVFNIPSDSADPDLLKIWDEAGATYVVHREGVDPGPLIPWRRLGRARIRAPFLVSVEHAWVRAPLVGGGGNAWYLCLFGWTISLGDAYTWQT